MSLLHQVAATGGVSPQTNGAMQPGKVGRLCKDRGTMAPLRPSTAFAGFTLVELVIAVALVGVLAAVALPSFLDQIRKSRRADAHDLAAAITQAQERYRIGHSRFASAVDELADEGIASTSAAGRYQVSFGSGTGVGYSFTITPLAGSSQANDRQCTEFKVVMLRGGLTRSAKDSLGGDSSTACWPQ